MQGVLSATAGNDGSNDRCDILYHMSCRGSVHDM
jgi:hypothetical protein